MTKAQKPVQGYLYDGVGDEFQERNNTMCQIISRVEGAATLETGPAFMVEFGDLFQMIAYSSELSPYYQID